MMPKNMMANINSAAVGAMSLTASSTISPMPSPAPAMRPKMVGTRSMATMGVRRPSMISVMKVRIMVKPRTTSTPSEGV